MPLNDVLAMEMDAQGVGNGFSDGRRDVTQVGSSLGAARRQTERVVAPQGLDPMRVIMWGIVLADVLLLYIALRV